MAKTHDSATRIYLDAVLYPHRSLSMRGFFILMVVLASVSFAAGVYFVSRGAWPVLGFFGLDVLAVYVAFRLSYRSGLMAETVKLTDEALTITRRLPSGKIDEWRFEPSWARVEIGEDALPENHLRLRIGGDKITIGGFLAPRERIEFAEVLRRALATRAKSFARI